MRVKYHLWHVVLIRLNCGAEKNIHWLMTFVLGDKLAGVRLTLQLVNLGRWADAARRAPGLQPRELQRLPQPRHHSWGSLPTPCSPGCGAGGEGGTGRRAPHVGTQEIGTVSPGALSTPASSPSCLLPDSTDAPASRANSTTAYVLALSLRDTMHACLRKDNEEEGGRTHSCSQRQLGWLLGSDCGTRLCPQNPSLEQEPAKCVAHHGVVSRNTR